MNYIYFGTPEFAAITLEDLIAGGMMPAAVICTPDKPVGRNQKLTPPPVKRLALEHGLPILQPDTLSENTLTTQLESYTPDLFIVAAYGKLLPADILHIPKAGTLNVHPSLLPKWRGPSPIQASILAGDTMTGVTIMELDEEMDHGPILDQREFPVDAHTAESLGKTLAKAGASLLLQHVEDYIRGEISTTPQNHEAATYCTLIKKNDGLINWQRPAAEIERMTRAYNPWPGAYTFWQSKKETKKMTIIAAKTISLQQDKQPGTVFQHEEKPAVICGEGALVLETVQLAGKNPTDGASFLNGYPQFIGANLGNPPA